jgi:hypothetical protein
MLSSVVWAARNSPDADSHRRSNKPARIRLIALKRAMPLARALVSGGARR